MIGTIKKFLFVTISVFSIATSYAVDMRGIVEERAVYEKKEIINDTIFIYKEEMHNGVHAKKWTINNQIVNEKEFLDSILEAEKEVARKQRIAQEQSRARAQEARQQALLSGYKKMLHLTLERIQAWLGKFDKHNLYTYLVLSDHTYPTYEAFQRMSQHLLPEAVAFDGGQHSIEDLGLYVQFLEQLHDVPDRLSTIFYATTNNAIQLCNDTKVLKELLDMISQT